ncbi:MAG: hypothetical protein U0232_15730 [Thermomicrobiales bacterium]
MARLMRRPLAISGISTDQLKQDATDLGSLQAIAAKYGKDNDAGKAGLKSTIEQAIKDQLTKNGVPQEMIDRIVSEFDSNFDRSTPRSSAGACRVAARG